MKYKYGKNESKTNKSSLIFFLHPSEYLKCHLFVPHRALLIERITSLY